MSPKTAIALRKQLAFSLVAVALVWALLELLTLGYLWLRPWKGLDFQFLFQAHPYRAFAPVPNARNTMGTQSFNSLGLRGREISANKSPNTIRILCLGGSTTVSPGATTDTRTFPAQMGQLLGIHYQGAPFQVEVLNAGVNAANSLESLIYFETRLLDLSPDIAIFHHVINDSWFMMDFPDFQSDYSHARRTFSIPARRLWEYSPVLSFLFARNTVNNPYFPERVVNLNLLIVNAPHGGGESRGATAAAQMEPAMVESLVRNLRTFVCLARGNGVTAILSTEVFTNDPTVGGHLIEPIARLNQAVRDVAQDEGVDLIDFARSMSWNPNDFSDSCHLRDHPQGLGRKAKIFADYLIQHDVIGRAIAQRNGRGLPR